MIGNSVVKAVKRLASKAQGAEYQPFTLKKTPTANVEVKYKAQKDRNEIGVQKTEC